MNQDEQIFDHIRELMTRDDFRNAQAEFFKANHGKFQTQENEGEAQFKLEHKTIHEDYLGLVEKFIEMKLQMEFGHSDEEMDHFYLTFKDKFKAYEAKDPESVDILYGFLDLEKFFAQMVETSKALAGDVNTNENSKVHQAEVLLDVQREKGDTKEYLDMLSADPEDPSHGWIKKIDQSEFQEGVKMKAYQKAAKEGGADVVKLECEVQDLEFKDITGYYLNPSLETMQMLKVNEVIEQTVEPNGIEFYEMKYWRLKIPMMSDRDNVIKCRFLLQEDGRLFGMATSVEHPDYPPQPGCVRMHNFLLISMEMLPNGNLMFKQISQGKLMGYVPNSLMNMMICNEVFKEHKNMFRVIKKSKAK